MSSVTQNLAAHIAKQGINLSKVSRDTGVPYQVLLASIGESNRGRDLRDIEFLKICEFLNEDPMKFANFETEKEDWKMTELEK